MFEYGVVIGLIIALGQFVKPYIAAKYIPIVTMILGVVAGFFYLPAANVQEAVIQGVMVGLAANGLFDMTKVLHK